MKRKTYNEQRTTKTLPLSIALIGFTAMAAEIVLLREFLIVFSGNELSIGILLANWLLGGALGSFLIGKFADRAKNRVVPIAACGILMAAFLPVSVAITRSIKVLLGVPAGAILPLGPLAVSSFLVMAPSSMVLGFMFAFACRIRTVSGPAGAAGISRAYTLETAGASLGGLAASFFLVRFMDPVHIMAFLGALNIITALILLARFKETAAKIVLGIAIAMFAVYLSAYVLKWWDDIESYSLARQWRSFNIVSSGNSIYGNVVLAERSGLYSFFDNGLHLYTVPDPQRQEEAVHFALLEHLSPRDILLIGGGAGGLIDEILKYPVRKVDYVELDSLIVNMARESLPPSLSRGLDDPRVAIRSGDGRFYVKTADEKYDCILLDVGDPYTAQINRFYTVEFFMEARRILKPGGLLSFSVSSSEDFINRELADFLKSLHRTLGRVFKDVRVIPGNTAVFLASDTEGLLTCDYRKLMGRALLAGLDLKYVREYYLSSRMSASRLSRMEDIVNGPPRARSNYDFRPVGYYYGMIFWASRFRDSAFGSALKALGRMPLGFAAASLCFIIIGLAILARSRRHGPRAVIIGGLGLSGYDGMAFQVITLLSFQIIYGYLFYKLGIMLTFFMIGLACGSRFVMKVVKKRARIKKMLISAQLAWGLYFLISPAVFIILANNRSSGVLWVGSNILFPAISFLTGAVSGAQFALTARAFTGGGDMAGKAGSLAYGTDLAGSCAGAVLTASFLIPVAGIVKASLTVGFVNFAMAVALALSLNGRKARKKYPYPGVRYDIL